MESGVESGVESEVNQASQRHGIEKGGQPWMRRPCGCGAPGCFDPSGCGRKEEVKRRRAQGRGRVNPRCDDPVEAELPDASTQSYTECKLCISITSRDGGLMAKGGQPWMRRPCGREPRMLRTMDLWEKRRSREEAGSGEG